MAFHVDCIETVIKELEEKGIEVEPGRYDDFTGKKMTFFHDPDGLPLELHEYSTVMKTGKRILWIKK